jgi:hypothetical protein
VPHADKPEPVDAEAKRESLSYGGCIDALPPAFFLAVHVIGFLLGAFFAYRAFEGTAHLMGWGFSLHVLADLVYMTYHLNWTAFLFTHTISEVLDLVAFVLLFVAATRGVGLRQPGHQSISVPAAR